MTSASGTVPPPAATSVTPPVPRPSSPAKRWTPRIIPQWDKNAKLVAQAATRDGKIALLGLFGLLLFVRTPLPLWLWTMAVLVTMSFLPAIRRNLLTAGTLGTAIVEGYVKYGQAGFQTVAMVYGPALITVLLFGLLLFKMAVKWPRSGAMRRPVLTLNLVFVALVYAAAVIPLPRNFQREMRFTLVLLTDYLWYFAYTLQDRLEPGRDGALRQVGTWAPFWATASGPGTPFCKGAGYLRRIEAKTPTELAVTQIKGVKLLMWCLVLEFASELFTKFAYQAPWGLSLTDLDVLIQTGHFPAWYLCWGSLLASFAHTVLAMAVWGNTIVACCRMAGFRALRNTYRPLQASSIAEFWNRYYYYFKELLVDFFFYPVYMRYFKRHRRLRMFAATLAAATLGNMIYHFFRDIDLVFQLGPWQAIAGFRVYALYTLALGCGIGVSQLWQQPGSGPQRWWRRILPATRVIAFFCLLHIFDYTGRDHSIAQHMRFLLHLFNLV